MGNVISGSADEAKATALQGIQNSLPKFEAFQSAFVALSEKEVSSFAELAELLTAADDYVKSLPTEHRQEIRRICSVIQDRIRGFLIPLASVGALRLRDCDDAERKKVGDRFFGLIAGMRKALS